MGARELEAEVLSTALPTRMQLSDEDHRQVA
jgi:hypothetical protein